MIRNAAIFTALLSNNHSLYPHNKTTMMTRSIFTLGIAALATVADATKVAVIEFGNGGVVHNTAASLSTSSPNGVMSFWRSMHDAGSDS